MSFQGEAPSPKGGGRAGGEPPGPRRVSAPPPRPLLVYDGDCAFCRRWARRLRAVTKSRADYAPYQEAAAIFPEIPRGDFEKSIQLIGPDGSVTSGAEAAYRTLALVPAGIPFLRLYERAPFFAALSEKIYGFVSRHRHRL
ncbi:MAG: thiol-disulfide oxidoreductase DCC family protein [Elusimicrobiota bacterium]